MDDKHWASEFAGKWEDERSADEIVADIREARTSNREIELCLIVENWVKR